MKNLSNKELLDAALRFLSNKVCYQKLGDRGTVLKQVDVEKSILPSLPGQGTHRSVFHRLEDGRIVMFSVIVADPSTMKAPKDWKPAPAPKKNWDLDETNAISRIRKDTLRMKILAADGSGDAIEGRVRNGRFVGIYCHTPKGKGKVPRSMRLIDVKARFTPDCPRPIIHVVVTNKGKKISFYKR